MRECILTVQAIGITLFDLNLTAIAFKFNTGGGIFFLKEKSVKHRMRKRPDSVSKRCAKKKKKNLEVQKEN